MPLLSVVIPTHKRPQFLARAIDSALQSAPDGDAEVVVVPNGPDESWRPVATSYARDPRVLWQPIAISHPSAARNQGLKVASGKYIRFLDDDDYLLEGAQLQCVLMDVTTHDVSQGGIDVTNSRGTIGEKFTPVESDDFVQSILSGRIFTLCHSLLWRRDRIKEHQWDVTLRANEDVAWALGIAADMEVSMHHHQQSVGVWVHHSSQSISRMASQLSHDRSKAEILLTLAISLEHRSALTTARRAVIGTSLWNCIHNSFPIAPIYWTRIAATALRLFPGSRPDVDGLRGNPFSSIHPLATEFLMAPHRFLRHAVRMKSSH